MEDAAHRAAIQCYLEQTTGDDWEDLEVGLLRARPADRDVLPMLKTRFGDDSIKRSTMLQKLIRSLNYRSDLAQVVIDLLEHPALDAPAQVMVRDGQRTETSLRAALYLKELSPVQAQHRPSFMPLLQKLLESGKNGESDAARQVLQAWK